MKKIAQGELLRRLRLNRKRLSDDIYSYPGVFNQQSDWPGDWEGRCILALTSLYFAFNGYPDEQKSIKDQVDEIVAHLPEYVNQDGYFGDLVSDSFVNEQQVSGNSWFLRGLIEYYQITEDAKILAQINEIVERLLLPIRHFYSHYPLTGREQGGVGGHCEGKVTDGWLTSSDVGCAFIMLDAMSEVYYHDRSEKLKSLLEEVIDAFAKIDFVSLQCQTHATLSCARGILTFYRASGEKKYLDMAESIFEKYVQCGMTKDFSNINWFKRPDTWTEPCCIVDSFILASQLFEITEQTKYLVLLNRIYLNSFRLAQRGNGGAGCNTCLYGDEKEIKVHLYEAYFCCTMRFAEGLRFVKKYMAYCQKDALLLSIPQEMSLSLCSGGSVSVEGDLYEEGKLKIRFQGIEKPLKVSIYIPSSLNLAPSFPYRREGDFLFFEAHEDGEREIEAELLPHQEDGLYFVGDRLLVKREARPDEKVFLEKETPYHYVVDCSLVSGEKETLSLRQKL